MPENESAPVTLLRAHAAFLSTQIADHTKSRATDEKTVTVLTERIEHYTAAREEVLRAIDKLLR